MGEVDEGQQERSMSVSETTYRQIALEDPSGHWELHCGRLRQKPDMSFEHNYVTTQLFLALARQLDERVHSVRANMGHVRRTSQNYYIPDVYVVPTDLVRAGRAERPNDLEVYERPLPLVVEVWSPSTGDYDADEKLPEYQRRGDLEIWRIHPYEGTLTAWRRQSDGRYTETLYRGGSVQPVALSGVTIDLDALFA
jgi:Uma2 family endonuclease